MSCICHSGLIPFFRVYVLRCYPQKKFKDRSDLRARLTGPIFCSVVRFDAIAVSSRLTRNGLYQRSFFVKQKMGDLSFLIYRISALVFPPADRASWGRGHSAIGSVLISKMTPGNLRLLNFHSSISGVLNPQLLKHSKVCNVCGFSTNSGASRKLR